MVNMKTYDWKTFLNDEIHVKTWGLIIENQSHIS